MANIKLGFVPTRRSIFSAPAAEEYANLTRKVLREMGVDFVDIDDIASDGLLHSEEDRIEIEKNLKLRVWMDYFFRIVISERSLKWQDLQRR